ncbi:unnamed protein product, partial [Meganyctiphanes norvegica]
APQAVEVLNTTESTMIVCWAPPEHGVPQGYTLTYTPMPRGRTGVLNLTLDDLTISENPAHNKTRKGTFTTKGAPIERYCAKVGGLQRWIEYVVRVRAWAGIRVSMGAEPITATTRNDFCGAGVCGEHGNCTLQHDDPGYACHCEQGYYGDNCEAHNPCLTGQPCSGYGTCHKTTNNGFTCNCYSGFYGKDCSQFDPCQATSINPCQNEGICKSEESGSYKCQCQHGYWGSTCENWDPCSSTPCQNMATCTNISSTEYTCICVPGFTGFDCQLDIDECASHRCQNRATCIDHVAHYTCSCIVGYTGVYCEEEIDECKVKPCVNGVCVDHLGDFECQCAKGWGGKTCYIDLESCPAQTTSTNIGEIIWPSTKHGGEVTVKCPYGITSTTQTLLQFTTTNLALTTTYLPTTTSNIDIANTATFSPTKNIPTTFTTSSLQYEDVNEVPEILSSGVSFDVTTNADWEDGSFTIERRHRRDLPRDLKLKQQRNMNYNKDDIHLGATPALKQANRHGPSARHHLINSRIRGTRTGLQSQIYQQRQQLSGQTDTQRVRSQTKYRKSIEHIGLYNNERNRQHSRSSRYGESKAILKEGLEEENEGDLRIGEKGVEKSKTEESLIRDPRKREPRTIEPNISEHRIGEIRIDEARIIQTEDKILAESQKDDGQMQNPRIGDTKVQETPMIGEIRIQEANINQEKFIKINDIETTSKEVKVSELYIDDPIIVNTERIKTKIDPHNINKKITQEQTEGKLLRVGDNNQHISSMKQYTDQSITTNKGNKRVIKDTPNIDEINRYGLRIDAHSDAVFGEMKREDLDKTITSVAIDQQAKLNLEKREDIKEETNTSNKNNTMKESYDVNEVTESILFGGVRACILLPNGTVSWSAPDTTKCRVKETQEAEERTKNLADITSTPKSVNVDVFTNTVKQLADLVNLALNDTRVAVNLVDVLSNMMDVNDSVVAAGEVENNTSQSIVKTINTFAEKVSVDPGNKVTLHSSNLVVEARVLSPSYGKLKAVFRPYQDQQHEAETEPMIMTRNKRDTNNSSPKGPE